MTWASPREWWKDDQAMQMYDPSWVDDGNDEGDDLSWKEFVLCWGVLGIVSYAWAWTLWEILK